MGKRELSGAVASASSALRRAVFLDRDGVINRALVRKGKPYPPASLEEFEFLPGVEEACRLLKESSFLLAVATNQPDVGRGTQSRLVVESIHRHLCCKLPVDRIEVCYEEARRLAISLNLLRGCYYGRLASSAST